MSIGHGSGGQCSSGWVRVALVFVQRFELGAGVGWLIAVIGVCGYGASKE